MSVPKLDAEIAGWGVGVESSQGRMVPPWELEPRV